MNTIEAIARAVAARHGSTTAKMPVAVLQTTIYWNDALAALRALRDNGPSAGVLNGVKHLPGVGRDYFPSLTYQQITEIYNAMLDTALAEGDKL